MFCVAMAVLLLVSSCSSKKKLVSPMPHVADYEWMSAKMTMDITAPGAEFNHVSGNLRMRRDSTVWISATAFMGMESLRMVATPDSVVMVNRMNQTYLAEPYAKLAETLQVPSFKEIQALLLGDGSNDQVTLHWGPYRVNIRYSDIHWDEPTQFPIKINKNYQRIKP